MSDEWRRERAEWLAERHGPLTVAGARPADGGSIKIFVRGIADWHRQAENDIATALREAEERGKAEDGEWCRALLRVVQANPGFDWRDYDDGILPDQAAQFLIDDLSEAWSDRERLLARLREPDEEMVEAVAYALCAKQYGEFKPSSFAQLPVTARVRTRNEALSALRAFADHLDTRGGE